MLSLKGQLPISGSGTTAKRNHNIYTIDFTQTMSMYNNNGAGKKKDDRWAPSINGLQVFEASKLGVAKCTIFQRSSHTPSRYSFESKYDLDFSVDTMMKAKLGGYH
ncbi:hypothetical protein APHAL10511_004215 [Amanita phalloides]|nr:hypothetical protein APHAL10511_004215 [Amanita phalloides]